MQEQQNLLKSCVNSSMTVYALPSRPWWMVVHREHPSDT